MEGIPILGHIPPDFVLLTAIDPDMLIAPVVQPSRYQLAPQVSTTRQIDSHSLHSSDRPQNIHQCHASVSPASGRPGPKPGLKYTRPSRRSLGAGMRCDRASHSSPTKHTRHDISAWDLVSRITLLTERGVMLGICKLSAMDRLCHRDSSGLRCSTW